MDEKKFAEEWPKIQAYIKDECSLIPIREKPDPKDPNKYPAKTPHGPWKMFQGRRMTDGELWHLLDKYSTTATAYVCGPISGNLCIFDIDIKYWNEIAVLVFTQIQELFDTDLLIQDDKQNAYQFFRNGFTHITSSKIEFKDYADFDMLVFKEKIKDRDWLETTELGVYKEFLGNSVGYDHYTLSIIGFCVHDFKNSSTGFIPVLTEQCENPKDGGGSGKNLFCTLFKYSTSFVSKNCSKVKYFDEKFYQIWTGQRLLALADLPANFDFTIIKEDSTGSIIHKKLFKDEVEVPVEKTPKIIAHTNYSALIDDGGVDRRIRLLEFTDFYTKAGGVDTYHGKHFPDDWTKEDWFGYDNIIALAIQIYLKQGCKINRPNITLGGWMKRFKQSHGLTATEIILKHIEKWTKAVFVSNTIFYNDLNIYCSENNIEKKPNLNKALKEFCEYKGILYEWDSQVRGGGRPNEKHRSFIKKDGRRNEN